MLTGAGLTGNAVATASDTPPHHPVRPDRQSGQLVRRRRGDRRHAVAGGRRSGDGVRFIVRRRGGCTPRPACCFPPAPPACRSTSLRRSRGTEQVRLTNPGLHVFVCKLHPLVLEEVIVDDPATPSWIWAGRSRWSTACHPDRLRLAAAAGAGLLCHHRPSQLPGLQRHPGDDLGPDVPGGAVLAYDQSGAAVSIPTWTPSCRATSTSRSPSRPPPPPATGVGEVWIDTEYELTALKTKPGRRPRSTPRAGRSPRSSPCRRSTSTTPTTCGPTDASS